MGTIFLLRKTFSTKIFSGEAIISSHKQGEGDSQGVKVVKKSTI